MIKLNHHIIEFQIADTGEATFDEQQVIDALSFFGQPNQVFFRFENMEDLIHLSILKKYLDTYKDQRGAFLIISQLPYERLPRATGTSPNYLHYVTDFINNLNFSHVYLHEPFSDSTAPMLKDAVGLETSRDLMEIVKKKIGFSDTEDYLVLTNLHATRRYKHYGDYRKAFYIELGAHNVPSQFILHEPEMEKGRKVIILDDEIDTSPRMKQIVLDLHKRGVKEIYIVATHARAELFENDLLNLSYLTKVFCTDTLVTETGHDKVEVALTVGWASPDEETIPLDQLPETTIQ